MSIVQKRSSSFFKSKIVLSISVVVLIFFLVGLVREIISRREINKQVSSLENQIDGLKSQNSQIGELINTWQDGGRLEKEARLRLGLQKPGEKTIIISQPEPIISSSKSLADVTNIPSELSEMSNDSVSNPAKWIHYFFK